MVVNASEKNTAAVFGSGKGIVRDELGGGVKCSRGGSVFTVAEVTRRNQSTGGQRLVCYSKCSVGCECRDGLGKNVGKM